MTVDLTRRSLLHGRLADPSDRPDRKSSVHISSAVVSVVPARRDEVMRALAALPGVEVHQRSASKIVVVMEAEDGGVIGGRLAEISCWQGVLSANMVFEQVEETAGAGG